VNKMGCWNHTCAITNLPICEGEEVEVILLIGLQDYNTSYQELCANLTLSSAEIIKKQFDDWE